MNELQCRLWKSMIEIIDNYIENKTQNFFYTVGQLEGAFDTCDIQNIAIVRQWYDFWTPLEILAATEGNSVNKDEALHDLIAMKKFLLKNLVNPPQSERQYELWKIMIDIIDNYGENKNQDFSSTISKLENALDASEFKDIDLISKWYDFWAPLDNRRTIEGNAVDRSKAAVELFAMKQFLLHYLVPPQ